MENFYDFHRSFSDLKVLVGHEMVREIYLILNSTGTKRKKKKKNHFNECQKVFMFFFLIVYPSTFNCHFILSFYILINI